VRVAQRRAPRAIRRDARGRTQSRRKSSAGKSAAARLEENSRKLIAAYKELAESIRQEHVISPAAEWLVDNFHIVEEQVREIREDLPRGYYQELPKLADGDYKDYPRIYALSIALVAHTDSHLDTETLRRFINAYQAVSPLSIGELWAVPISLRIALVENLRRLTTRIVSARAEREEADKLADKLLELIRRQPDEVVPLLASRYGKRKTMSHTFAVQLTQRLREQDPGPAGGFRMAGKATGQRASLD
jgi:cyclic beta-1,2-glucan synthetase